MDTWQEKGRNIQKYCIRHDPYSKQPIGDEYVTLKKIAMILKNDLNNFTEGRIGILLCLYAQTTRL